MKNPIRIVIEHSSKLPWVILPAGVIFSLFLQTLIKDEVFFSGDLGVMLLQVRQFLQEPLRLDFYLTGPEWVNRLWAEGLYPFEPPFVYLVEGKYHVPFFPLFSWISAPFYDRFGFRGLTIIPLVSVWAVWGTMFALGRRLELGTVPLSLALSALALASPLTLYGAMFWGHGPAVALCFAGLAIVLVGLKEGFSPSRAVAGGGLIGLSIFFRSECLCLAAAGALVLSFVAGPQAGKDHRGLAVFSMLLPVLLFFFLNHAIFGHPLGVHGRQVYEGLVVGESVPMGFSLHRQFLNGLKMMVSMGWLLAGYFPLVLALPLLCLFWARDSQAGTRVETRFLWAVGIVFFLTVPFVLPLGAWNNKQSGPRYLLPIVPIIALLAAFTLPRRISLAGLKNMAAWGLLMAALVWGGVVNSIAGTADLARDYRERIRPSVQLIRESPEKVVAVGLHYIPQEMATLFGSKYFFLAPDVDRMTRLCREVHAQGFRSFIYVRHVDHPAFVPERENSPLAWRDGNRTLLVHFAPLGRAAKYVRYRGSITVLE